MAIRVEHELHRRRFGRNLGVGLVLAGFVAIMFGLTVVKVMHLDDIRDMEAFDHVAAPASAADPAAAPAPAGDAAAAPGDASGGQP